MSVLIKMQIVLSVALLGATAGLASVTPDPAQAGAANKSGTVERGRSLYVRQGCYQCHGLVGQGSIISGPPLYPSEERASFVAYVRNPTGAMPPFTSKILTDAELADILTFVLDLPPKGSAWNIPLLASLTDKPATSAPKTLDAKSAVRPAAQAESVTGGTLYQQKCAACHGKGREGGIGPDLRPEAVKRNFAATLKIIIDPPARMPKLVPSSLSPKQATQIATFLHSPS